MTNIKAQAIENFYRAQTQFHIDHETLPKVMTQDEFARWKASALTALCAVKVCADRVAPGIIDAQRKAMVARIAAGATE